MVNEPVIAFLWHHFSQYHMDRCRALGEAFAGNARIVGFEVGSTSVNYAWGESGDGDTFTKVTLFPGQRADDIGGFARLRALVSAIRRERVSHFFISGYERPYCLALALLLRFGGRKVFVSLDSKFDDKPRRMLLELCKSLMMLPYHGGFAAGQRSEAYLRFLGLRQRPIAQGYDSVSIERLRSLTSNEALPAWEDRPFLAVARFIPKKNLSMALRGFAAYTRRVATPRRLRLCGGGVLESALRAEAETLGIGKLVDFLGFQSQEVIAREMQSAVCLLLPSTEEQWGLVVNEALAFGLPLIASTGVGASDLLLRTLRNGFILDPDEAEAWGEAMHILGDDHDLWLRYSAESNRRAALGDVCAFVSGVSALVGIAPVPSEVESA